MKTARSAHRREVRPLRRELCHQRHPDRHPLHERSRRAQCEPRFVARSIAFGADLWSVLKMSLCFFTAMVLMWLVSALVVWKIADSFGAVTRIESFVDNLFETKLVISPGIILKQGVVIAIVIGALCVIGSVIAAAFYNLFSELFGGIEIYTYEQDIDPRV